MNSVGVALLGRAASCQAPEQAVRLRCRSRRSRRMRWVFWPLCQLAKQPACAVPSRVASSYHEGLAVV